MNWILIMTIQLFDTSVPTKHRVLDNLYNSYKTEKECQVIAEKLRSTYIVKTQTDEWIFSCIKPGTKL